ncbi:unnamed protein product [Ectocarpus sp. 12 AP-2014]
MKLSIFVLGTTFASSALSFLPALFSLENYVRSCQTTGRLNSACQKLVDFTKPLGHHHHHHVNTLHGSWRQLLPKDPDSTTYQTIDYSKAFVLATTLHSNGTRVELIMPFDTCRRDETAYFTHARQFVVFADDSRLESNVTCSAQSFELVYASTSLRVDRMVSDGAFRVYVPCDDVFASL